MNPHNALADPTPPLRILAIAGSLRTQSLNRELMRAAARLDLPGIDVTVFQGLASIPLFDQDLEVPEPPRGVTELREALAESDALLIATPEYNQSVPGVVKNMIDWLSRTGAPEGLEGMPVAVTGATPGPWGTRIAQTVLRQMLTSAQAIVLPTPTLFIARGTALLDRVGGMTDPDLEEQLAGLVIALADWARILPRCTSRQVVG